MPLLDRRYLRAFDWLGFLIVLMLSSIGLLFVFSATYQPARPYSLFFKKQLFGTLTGLVIFLLFCAIDYRRLQRWGYFLYMISLGVLIFTRIKGTMGLGARRWINLGWFSFQPSELIKLFFPAFFTYYFMTHRQGAAGRSLYTMLAILAGSFLLIAKQPDLGTAIIVALTGLILLAFAGIGKKFFIGCCCFGLLGAPILWHCLKDYQKRRIMVFLGQGDQRKERYQIEQSYIAVGSGGLYGKGLLRGTQNILQFLPESRTDFIFSVLCEEWGLLGALFIIVLYLLLFMRWLMVIDALPDPHAQFLALGLVLPIMNATLINMCMVLGLLPVVGIPLPFMSYGITHTWITFAILGWFHGIVMRRGTIRARSENGVVLHHGNR